MSKITAADVKKLRDQTGAGMMDVKKALVEAEGDTEKAMDLLRKQGQKLSVRRAEREAKEGVVIAKVNENKDQGVVIRLSCETDFVAKNEEFVKFADRIADVALENLPDSLDDLLALQMDDQDIAGHVKNEVGVIGVTIRLVEYAKREAETVIPYIHKIGRATCRERG